MHIVNKLSITNFWTEPFDVSSGVTFLISNNYNFLTLDLENPVIINIFSPTKVKYLELGD